MNELTETEYENRLTEDTDKQKDNPILVRHVLPEDGQKIWSLVKSSGILDLNSAYCYLLLCQHFRNTCLVAASGNDLIGFVTAYKLPADETTLFVWQIAVEQGYHGQGIARRLITELLASEQCKNIRQLQATVSPSNTASLSLFRSLARELGSMLTTETYFDPSLFPGRQHEPEDLVTVGPFIFKPGRKPTEEKPERL